MKECAVCHDHHGYIYTCVRCKTTQCRYGMRRIVGTHKYLCTQCAGEQSQPTEEVRG